MMSTGVFNPKIYTFAARLLTFMPGISPKLKYILSKTKSFHILNQAFPSFNPAPTTAEHGNTGRDIFEPLFSPCLLLSLPHLLGLNNQTLSSLAYSFF